eukprot:SAG31_NODE_9363_length_1289_cov_2.280672_1_plen_58_part_00
MLVVKVRNTCVATHGIKVARLGRNVIDSGYVPPYIIGIVADPDVRLLNLDGSTQSTI